MTREDVKKLFPDATDEQVTAFLNKHNSEIAGERAKTNSERQRANALQDEKDQRERDGMDELQKVQADLAAMQKTLESAQAENKKLKLTADLAQRGVTGESARSRCGPRAHSARRFGRPWPGHRLRCPPR